MYSLGILSFNPLETMKKYILFTLFPFIFTMSSFAQKNIMKVGFVASGGMITGLQYERSVADNFSIMGQVGYATVLDSWLAESSKGIGLYVEGRYYFSKNKDLLEKWHAGIYTTYLNTESSDDFFSYDQNNISIGLVGGYQWVLTSHLTFDTLIGGGFLRFDDSDGSEDNGFYPLIGLNIGYNF